MTRRARPEVVIYKMYFGHPPTFYGADFVLCEKGEKPDAYDLKFGEPVYGTMRYARLAGQRQANIVAAKRRTEAAIEKKNKEKVAA